MATPMTLSQCKAQFDKWGIDYEVYSDAIGRPGSFTPIGFVLHHTGGPFTESDNYLRFLFVTGRSDVPAQLCQFSGGPSGKIYIGKMARANHAGAGWWRTRQLVGAESYNGYNDEIDPGKDDYNTGNGLYYGLEVNYPGTVPMKDAQWNSAVKLAAAIMDFHGWTALSCIGHREHSYRKWDPGSHTLWQFRRDVRDLLIKGPGGSPPPPIKDWFDMATEADLKKVVDASIDAKVPALVRQEVLKLLQTDKLVGNPTVTGNWTITHILDWLGRSIYAVDNTLDTEFPKILDAVASVLNLTEQQTIALNRAFIKYLADSANWNDIDDWTSLPAWAELSIPKLDLVLDILEPANP